jgi:glucose/arabinose dehydrogenase
MACNHDVTGPLYHRRHYRRLGAHQQGISMNFSSFFARIVALIGGAALLWRRSQGAVPKPAWGNAPQIPLAKPQGAIPTLKMPTARGWSEGQRPVAGPGLKVNAFAKGLDHPRWINVLPNGDVLVAEATQVAGPPRNMFHYAMQATMRRADALGVSANRITLLRDGDGDGVAEIRETFMEDAMGRRRGYCIPSSLI